MGLGDPKRSPEWWPWGSSTGWGVRGAARVEAPAREQHKAGLLYPESLRGSVH